MGVHAFVAGRVARALSRGRVHRGPFSGMRYARGSVGSTLPPKLLGTYELELQPAVEAIIAATPDLIVDVGAAEGYYAVGLARAVPAAEVIAFESEERGRRLLRAMAALNAVEGRVRLEGHCTADSLRRALQPGRRTVVVMDVEGAERDLLGPAVLPQLAACMVLVELHEAGAPGVGKALLERFAATHEAERIDQRPRTPGDWPFAEAGWGRVVPAGLRLRCMDEKRGTGMAWLSMRPRAEQAGRGVPDA